MAITEEKPLVEGDDNTAAKGAGDSAKTEKELGQELADYLLDGKLDDGELDELTNSLTAFDDLPEDERDQHLKAFLVEFKRQVVKIEKTEGPIPPPKYTRRLRGGLAWLGQSNNGNGGSTASSQAQYRIYGNK